MNFSAFKDVTRIEQTLFGLPFLLAGALLPFAQIDVSFSFRCLWIFPAFLLARVSGMAFNQLIDSHIDKKNPRTENRAIPSGRVGAKQVQILAWAALALFLLVCLQINTVCFLLAPFAAFLLFIYSYLKRVTASCHFVLSVIHFLGPVMASAAIANTLLLPPILLGAAAACLIIGIDVTYAVQDVEFDRSNNLFSLPARLGVEKSLTVARASHIFSLLLLFCVGVTAHLPIFYYLLIPLAAAIFFKFHKKAEEEVVEPLIFSCTVMISLSVFAFILASIVWDVM